MTKLKDRLASWPIEKTHEWTCLETPKGASIPRGCFRRLDARNSNAKKTSERFVGNQ